MTNSQSHFLRDSSNRSNRNLPPRLTVTTPPPSVVVSVARSGSSQTGNVSPTIRRWQATFQVIRQDRLLLNEFLRRLQTRGDVFGRYFLLRFEDTLRGVLRQELHQVFTCLNLPPRLLPDQSIPAQFRLCFINSVKSPIFTTDKVDPIQVGICDSCTKKISPDCPFSSAKVRIIVLDAEFWKNKGETWSRREFNDSILSNRDGKPPILTSGGRTVQLKNGVGPSEEICFGDNSSWTKSGFRLGVMVEVEQEENGERVQEGVSESFRVLDRRGKGSQKPNQLKLEHNVQKLKKIGKDRAYRLKNNKKYEISTVEEFLSLYYRDPNELREILGIKSETDKEWETMVYHAMECADEFHAKYEALEITSQPQLVLVNTSGSNGVCVVGSGSSEPNPYENCLYPGLGQLETLNDLVPKEVLFPNAESPSAEYQALGNTGLPQQAVDYPLERNASPLRSGGPLVLGSSSSESNSGNNVNHQGDTSASYEQLSPICDLPSIASGEQISAAHPVETQSIVFGEINITIETGNMGNVNSMQQTNDNGSPQLSTDLDPMEYLNADADSDYIWQGASVSLSSSVNVGPLSPHRWAKRKALLKWIIWPAVARKRARII